MNIEEMIAVVQCYIAHRTNREVNISHPTNYETMKLVDLYETAVNFFQVDPRGSISFIRQ